MAELTGKITLAAQNTQLTDSLIVLAEITICKFFVAKPGGD
jgi:hypothetical protein